MILVRKAQRLSRTQAYYAENVLYWATGDDGFLSHVWAVAIAKATWAWVRGKCEEAMREVLAAM